MKTLIVTCMFLFTSGNLLFAQQNESSVQDINNPKDNDCVNFFQDIPNGVNNSIAETTFNVYPNPNTGRFTISLPLNTTALTIYSTSGVEVYTTSLDGTEKLMPADISELGAALYFVCITVDEIQHFIRMAVTK